MENLNVTEFDDGVVKCPFHPQANSTSLLQANGNMFVGSATDFSGSDVAIIRTPVQSNGVSNQSRFLCLFFIFVSLPLTLIPLAYSGGSQALFAHQTVQQQLAEWSSVCGQLRGRQLCLLSAA